MTTATETPTEAANRIESMGFGKNDVIVIQAFAAAGIPPELIDPRRNVLTFRAWKGKGRQVAKGAKSVGVTVWIPSSTKKSDPEPTDGGDGEKKKRGGMRPKTARLFHVSQTIPLGSEKGTRPEAWENPALIREGTYEPETPEESEPADVEPGPVEPWTDETTLAQVDAEMRAKLTGQAVQPFDDGGPTIADIQPEPASECSCPMVGVVTNVDCPLHGGR